MEGACEEAKKYARCPVGSTPGIRSLAIASTNSQGSPPPSSSHLVLVCRLPRKQALRLTRDQLAAWQRTCHSHRSMTRWRTRLARSPLVTSMIKMAQAEVMACTHVTSPCLATLKAASSARRWVRQSHSLTIYGVLRCCLRRHGRRLLPDDRHRLLMVLGLGSVSHSGGARGAPRAQRASRVYLERAVVQRTRRNATRAIQVDPCKTHCA